MIAYLDCSSGMSGDMTLGALIDAGLPCERLKGELTQLKVQGYEIRCRKVLKAGVSATKVDVIVNDTATMRRWEDVKRIIDESTLSDSIKIKGLSIFRRLFSAEAQVHGSTYDKVHLHELGAIDCLIDIFGSLIGFEALNIEKVYSSPVNLGSGTVKTSHGTVPVPAPATAALLKEASVYGDNISMELTTPTGAAILSSLVKEYGSMPLMKILKTGYGAGQSDIEQKPNVLRIIVGQEPQDKFLHDTVTIVETNIDDMNPQLFDNTMEMIFNAGALDVFLTPIYMKKTRPATKLTAIVKRQDIDRVIDIIIRETTTFGVRMYETDRCVLDRQILHIETPYGRVGVKIGKKGENTVKESFEYEDLKKIAQNKKIPLNKVIDEARKALLNFQQRERNF